MAAGPIPAQFEPAGPASRAASAPTRLAEEIESRIFELTNQARGARPALQAESGLRAAARLHSGDMARNEFFDHVNQQGDGPVERVALVHRRMIGQVAENIWAGGGLDLSAPETIARAIVAAWMGSPGHRANIESALFTHLGVGVSVAGGRVFATQDFAYVHAWTSQDVPFQVKPGELVSISAQDAAGNRPLLFDLADPASGEPVQAPRRLDGTRWRAAPGRYLLRFYFRDGIRNYAIYNGPMVQMQ
jgi:uncharacterized protein YkwD